ncbi:hypothetical protein M413DRAFT_444283 [Hebeloma cylindrosporum]|uniref:Uncharacterized protein n=1 Tax=Hebeloma cylindrosporum TaxID=76867 RepID=A0A0C3CG38_HEBCY|nr:hypothetical protein M413DRAFT_444283 [Hebeloma cylindrosporum h7]
MQLYLPNYELPKTVISVRDGWQWTCQSGAVVSGLLAGVGAQLLGSFQAANGPAGAKEFLVATCYASIFLNIAATICSFVVIDHLGEIGFEAAAIRDPEEDRKMGRILTSQERLLMSFGASSQWKAMLYHWLITFYLGILCLIIALLTYVAMTASKPTKIVMSLLVAFTLLPTTYFVFLRPVFGRSKKAPNNAQTPVDIQMEEQDSLASVSTAPPMPQPHLSPPMPNPHPHMSTSSVGYISVTIPPAVGPMTPS